MKNIVVTLISILSAQSAHASGILDIPESPMYRVMGYRTELDCQNHADCKTAGGSAVVSTAAGVYAAKKFRDAKRFEAANSIEIINATDGMKPLSGISALHGVVDGDKVTIAYQLSEADNRLYHIKLYSDMAKRAERSANTYASMAVAAAMPQLRPEVTTEIDSQGKVTTKTTMVLKSDMASFASYTAMAESERTNARNYQLESDAVLTGQKKPDIHTISEVVEDDAGNRAKAGAFIDERVDKGGKIMNVKRLPLEALKRVRTIVKVAKGGVAGSIVMGVVAAEEAMLGFGGAAIDKAVKKNGWSPNSRNSLTAR